MLPLLEPRSPLLPLTHGSGQDSKTSSRNIGQAGAQDFKDPRLWLRSQALMATQADGALCRGSRDLCGCVLEPGTKRETSPTVQARV